MQELIWCEIGHAPLQKIRIENVRMFPERPMYNLVRRMKGDVEDLMPLGQWCGLAQCGGIG
jgi:hypothetical protein